MRGFTLVELMVAMVIFAVLGFAVTSRVGELVSQTYSLERRSVAHWVAENHLVRMRLAADRTDELIPTGTDRERLVMGNRQWVVESEILDTVHPWLRRVEISVYESTPAGEQGPIESLTGFLGRY